MSECEYCKAIGETMLVGGNGETFVSLVLHGGGLLQMFDSDYPGWQTSIIVNYCPMCGRKLEVEG